MIIAPLPTNVQIVAEPAKWLGETFGFWVQFGVQSIIFAASAVAGILVIRSRAHQEGRRSTVDLIVEQKRDEKLMAARHLIVRMHENKEDNLARYLNDKESEQYKAIMLSLNSYEFVACGIKTGAFSDKVYKRLRYSTLIRDWKAFEGFVIEFRKKHEHEGDTFFQDFEWLYKKWKRKPLKPNKKNL